MTTFAIIVALVIGGALCMLVGYAIGATHGERDGARRERLMAEAWRSLWPPCPTCDTPMVRTLHGHYCHACNVETPGNVETPDETPTSDDRKPWPEDSAPPRWRGRRSRP